MSAEVATDGVVKSKPDKTKMNNAIAGILVQLHLSNINKKIFCLVL